MISQGKSLFPRGKTGKKLFCITKENKVMLKEHCDQNKVIMGFNSFNPFPQDERLYILIQNKYM